MSGAHGDGLAADVELDELARVGEVGSEAAAGGVALVVVAEADGLRVPELEVGQREATEGGGGEEGVAAHFGGVVVMVGMEV